MFASSVCLNRCCCFVFMAVFIDFLFPFLFQVSSIFLLSFTLITNLFAVQYWLCVLLSKNDHFQCRCHEHHTKPINGPMHQMMYFPFVRIDSVTELRMEMNNWEKIFTQRAVWLFIDVRLRIGSVVMLYTCTQVKTDNTAVSNLCVIPFHASPYRGTKLFLQLYVFITCCAFSITPFNTFQLFYWKSIAMTCQKHLNEMYAYECNMMRTSSCRERECMNVLNGCLSGNTKLLLTLSTWNSIFSFNFNTTFTHWLDALSSLMIGKNPDRFSQTFTLSISIPDFFFCWFLNEKAIIIAFITSNCWVSIKDCSRRNVC